MAAPISATGMTDIRQLTSQSVTEKFVENRPITEPKATPSGSVTGQPGASFSETLGNALTGAGKAEKAADEAAGRFAAGDPQMGIHEVMIAAEKASISVRYAVTLKNKLLEAYRELMNTPL